MTDECEMGLFRKFGHIGYGGRSLVNYENLVNFLIKSRIDHRRNIYTAGSLSTPALAGM